jgi:hypothetical protein
MKVVFQCQASGGEFGECCKEGCNVCKYGKYIGVEKQKPKRPHKRG